jgi:photosystem II stability/assembly factor-like uncharacterized protein
LCQHSLFAQTDLSKQNLLQKGYDINNLSSDRVNTRKEVGARKAFLRATNRNQSKISYNQQSSYWNVISDLNNEMSSIYFIDSLNGWVIGYNGEINYSSDGGFSWSPQNSGTIQDLQSIFFIDSIRGFSCGYNSTLIYTTNKGSTWLPIQVESDSSLIYSSLCSDKDTNLYFVSNSGKIFKSNDLGKHWDSLYNFNEWGFTYLDFSHSPTCFAMKMWGNELYKSTDSGNHWNMETIPVRWSADIYFLNSDTGWVTENVMPSSLMLDSASIYKTVDGGESWIKQSTILGGYPQNIFFVDNHEGWLQDFVTENIYYTSDGGETWTNQYKPDTSDTLEDLFILDRDHGWALTFTGKIVKYQRSTSLVVNKNEKSIVCGYSIHQNYPNPFNPSTTISFSLPSKSFISLKVFDMLGREVATIVSEQMSAGSHSVLFNGSSLASGVYYYRLQAGSFAETKKLVLLR